MNTEVGRKIQRAAKYEKIMGTIIMVSEVILAVVLLIGFYKTTDFYDQEERQLFIRWLILGFILFVAAEAETYYIFWIIEASFFAYGLLSEDVHKMKEDVYHISSNLSPIHAAILGVKNEVARVNTFLADAYAVCCSAVLCGNGMFC